MFGLAAFGVVPFGGISGGFTGTASNALGVATLNAAGTVRAAGTLSQTLAALAATTTNTDVLVKGTLSQTLGALTVSATGASGAISLGTLNLTLGPLSVLGVAKDSVVGTLGQTLATISLNGVGGSGGRTGTLIQSLEPLAISASSGAPALGSLVEVLDALSVSGIGLSIIRGTLAKTLDALVSGVGQQGEFHLSGNANLEFVGTTTFIDMIERGEDEIGIAVELRTRSL